MREWGWPSDSYMQLKNGSLLLSLSITITRDGAAWESTDMPSVNFLCDGHVRSPEHLSQNPRQNSAHNIMYYSSVLSETTAGIKPYIWHDRWPWLMSASSIHLPQALKGRQENDTKAESAIPMTICLWRIIRKYI